MKKILIFLLFMLMSSCVEGTSISTVSHRQENSCHVMRVPRGWRIHSISGDGSAAVLTKARLNDEPKTYMIVGAYGRCYNIYEEQLMSY